MKDFYRIKPLCNTKVILPLLNYMYVRTGNSAIK